MRSTTTNGTVTEGTTTNGTVTEGTTTEGTVTEGTVTEGTTTKTYTAVILSCVRVLRGVVARFGVGVRHGLLVVVVIPYTCGGHPQVCWLHEDFTTVKFRIITDLLVKSVP